MTNWAILSGIEGNLAAYEAVLADIKRQRQSVEELYILGDVIAPIAESEKVIQRVRSPCSDEPMPQVCQGWWEEQLLKAIAVKPRQVIGVGNVGRIPGQATYTLYNPGSNQVEFRTVRYGSGKGFQPANDK